MKYHLTARALVVLALAASAAPLFAQVVDGASPWYGGVGMGQARATIDDERIGRNLSANGFASSISDREHAFGYKMFGGYRLNENFALEGGYFSLGKFGYTAATTPTGTLTGDARLRGLNLDLVGTLPVTARLSVLARSGLTYVDTRDKFSSTGLVVVNNPSPSEHSANWKLGLGVQYAMTSALSLRTEIERYRIRDAVGNRGDVDMVTVGLVYRFGAGGR
ncbi:hypothetical protein RD110_22240 [Rhodoferax koreense]|uniref:Outer membrane protein OmpA-like transmembrane domain-containing protein n=1 Tax=Rhodoferax koreensis TaxID=1842727 RepID=A0A1P8K0R1_9BURK|nr:outer membrane beta-barrel protein [Rhodoferax koreense]APW39589.1 hypothetical protein RD110_22240 [Rhodoferax koreense]